MGLLCCRLGIPRFSSLSHMQDLVSSFLLTWVICERVSSCPYLGYNALGMI